MSTDDFSVRASQQDPATVLAVSGVLDSTTYLRVRDAIVKSATDAPKCLIVDVRGLEVPAPSAWAVLTSAAWLVRGWPGIPVGVVADPVRLAQLRRGGITRSVPAFPSLDVALDRMAEGRSSLVTQRVRTTIPRGVGSPLAAARGAVADAVEKWNPDYVPLALVLATILVRNVLAHTSSDPDLWIEVHNSDRLFVAVSDNSSEAPARIEDPRGSTPAASGLALLTSLSRHWSYTPRGTGKTVWAVIGPDEVARFARTGGQA
ncbi:sulfate transporter [Gordonia sp. C13]|uniref:sulfate transporter n=1 Tax=Gordonia sp. C13 TaxID=2935078 RepID=UPI00200AF018|nr:sulfate transporter [Gordonia sp. C13]MCK8614698.1 sulfate transporter [Gordonia sp. C13]